MEGCARPSRRVIAITRLRATVRCSFPATVSNPVQAMPKRLIGLLDRCLADVNKSRPIPSEGLGASL